MSALTPTARGLEQARAALADLMEWFTPEAQHRVVAGHFDRAREEGHASRDAEVAELRAEVGRARAEERAAVVAWLRAQRDESYFPPIPVPELRHAADAIERGAHIPPETTDAR